MISLAVHQVAVYKRFRQRRASTISFNGGEEQDLPRRGWDRPNWSG
jgi:hypothetical protein